MTVIELINKLQAFDPETLVLYPAGECSNCVCEEDVTDVKAARVKVRSYPEDVYEDVVMIGSYLS